MFGKSQSEVEYLREQVRMLQEANFRLTELLAQRNGQDLVLPTAAAVAVAAKGVEPAPQPPLPVTSDWLKDQMRGSGHTISSPVKEVTPKEN